MTDPETLKSLESAHRPVESDETGLILDIRKKFEEGRFIYADVPLQLIEKPGIPVDQEHVEELAEQMREYKEEHDIDGGNGQQEDVMLAQIEDDDSKLHIIEGLHRIPAIELNGDKYARCKILMGSSMEEVVKRRMSGIKEHPSIRVARAVTMLDEAWQLTEWKEKYANLSSAQVFSMTNDERSGKDLGISTDDVIEIKQWANDRAEECNLAVTTVDKHLRLIDAVDPEIIQNAREKYGKKDSPYFSSKNLHWLAKHLRGRFDEQKMVVSFAIENNLNSAQVEKTAGVVAGFDDVVKARAFITDRNYIKNIKRIKENRQKTGKKPGRESKPLPNEGVDNLVIAEIEVCNYSLQELIFRRGSYLCLPNTPKGTRLIDFEEGDKPNIPNRFFWSAEAVHEAEEVIDDIEDAILTSLSRVRINSSLLESDQSDRVFDIAKGRVIKDIKHGVVQYTGAHDFNGEIIDKQLVKGLTMRCIADTIDNLRGSTQGENGSKPQPKVKEPKNTAIISAEKFRQFLSRSPSRADRKIMTLATVFDLPAFAIAQIVQSREESTRNSLARMANDLTRKK